jgi:hypothetical protein
MNVLPSVIAHIEQIDLEPDAGPAWEVRQVRRDKYEEFQRVLATPGSFVEDVYMSARAYYYTQYNSPRHGPVIIIRRNFGRVRAGPDGWKDTHSWCVGTLAVEPSNLY